MRPATGQKDPLITLLRELGTEDGRRRENLFFAEGAELAIRAFDYGDSVKAVILTDSFAGSSEARKLIERGAAAAVETCTCTAGLLSKVLGAKPMPECVVIVERKIASLAELLSNDCPLIQMVENGDSADNLGMLLRSADAAGADGVVLAGETTDPFARRVVRASRGAVFTVPMCIYFDAGKVIEEARNKSVQVIAASANASTHYADIDYTKPTMIVVGSEHTGISSTVREHADAVVRIPMLGRINSLNIAVAASVMLYEAVRQRGYSRGI